MIDIKKSFVLVVAFAVIFTAFGTATAQRKKRSRTSARGAAQKPKPTPTPAVHAKKNGRPMESPVAETPVKPASFVPVFFYEFTRPGFKYPLINIEHNAAGQGSITFSMDDSDDVITDPLTVSAAALSRINAALDELDFVNSTEDYQFEKDYSHLGTNKIRIVRGLSERTAVYNWTSNKAAKALADEYRKLSNQYIWIFEINLARENQPLESPGLMTALESLIRRDEISDPMQMLPFLEKLKNDERIPLMGRNTAARIIEKTRKESNK